MLVVTHGGPIRTLCQRLLGLDPGLVVPASPASMSVIDIDGTARLCAYNVTPGWLSADPVE